LTIVLSVLHRCTVSDYHSGISPEGNVLIPMGREYFPFLKLILNFQIA
jgi:hypothetical protein